MSQNNALHYAKAIQFQLAEIVSPVPVYASFNRNYATQGQFLTWHLRNVHQPVFTGLDKDNKGIDQPVFQTSVFAKSMTDAFNLANSVLQSLHGYSGMFGDPSDDGFFIGKADIMWLYNTYDDEIGLHQIILDTTLFIQT